MHFSFFSHTLHLSRGNISTFLMLSSAANIRTSPISFSPRTTSLFYRRIHYSVFWKCLSSDSITNDQYVFDDPLDRLLPNFSVHRSEWPDIFFDDRLTIITLLLSKQTHNFHRTALTTDPSEVIPPVFIHSYFI